MASSGTSLKGIFFIFAVIAFILTTVALFTPGWRTYSNGYDYKEGIVVHRNGQSREPYERATLAFMILAFIFEIFLLLLAIGTFVSPKAKQLGATLGGLALLITIFLLIVISVYAAKYQDQHGGSIKLGFSYWLSVCAFIIMIFATLLGFAMMGAGKDDDDGGYPTARA